MPKPLLAVLCSIVALLSPLASPAEAAAEPPTQERQTPQKPASTTLTKHDSRAHVHVKFAEGSQVRLRDGHLTSTAGTDLSAVENVLESGSVSAVQRLFTAAEETLQTFTGQAATRSGRPQADLNQWYRLTLRPGSDPAAVIDRLNALDQVEIAYAEPLAAPPPIAPDFTPRQGYRLPATSSGIDADYARTVPGGTGGNVRVADIEYSWNFSHEDLSKARVPGTLVANGTPSDPFNNNNHGTAVLGELVGDNNSGGVTGLVPDAQLRVTNASNTQRGWDVANSVITAARALRPGDVLLIEQQTPGPAGCSGYVAPEWIPAIYDAIVATTSSGIHVVETAGNGSMNLDNPCFGTRFPRGMPDSGAIIEGAGAAPGCGTARTRLNFSTYGSRIDVQGWGNCVVTSGYGNLYNTGGSNSYYTHTFGGTSSAGPIVASAAASLSSVAKQRGISLTPLDLRARLKATGTPQVNPATGNIGPLPNLRAAINALPGGGNQVPNAAFTWSATGLTVRFTDTSTDPDSTITSRQWDFGDGTTSTSAAPEHAYSTPGTYAVRLTVTDDDGATSTATKQLTVSSGGSTPECTSSRTDELGRNCRRSNLSAATGKYEYFFLWVPAGVSKLVIHSSGSTGNADLYYSNRNWATTTSYTQRSTNAGSAETLTVNNPASGYHYISLYATQAFSGAAVNVEF
ncbi:PKD domain-containing protein [Nonomuraea lactucae]|uniref:PKD domain-containing protein n=1 Tax=Nonomuraea lactucae TaxID=2249762 RepID=UPI001F068CD1|nr:PKD domain-containing protein [Nonomuraea lactucae]